MTSSWPNELLNAKIERLETHRPAAHRSRGTMSIAVSPSTNRRYGFGMASRLWRVARATGAP